MVVILMTRDTDTVLRLCEMFQGHRNPKKAKDSKRKKKYICKAHTFFFFYHALCNIQLYAAKF